MTCSSTFLKYPLAVLAQTPAAYVLMYCNAFSTTFTAVRCFHLRKRYWDCKLPCIEAQIKLSSTLVYDQKMSTSGSSARNSHLSQGGRMTITDAHVCERICINMYCRAKHNNQEKNTHSLKEEVTKISEL